MNRVLTTFLLAMAALSSCSRGPLRAELQDIESYIRQRPDSALAAIRSVDTLQLRTKELRARYALLQAMALDKNYVDTADIRIIEPALAHYKDKGTRSMQAHYYAGRIYENGQDYPNALIHFNLALEDAPPQDYLYQGLICASLADVYHKSYSFPEALLYKQKSLEYIEQLGDQEYVDLGLFGLANAWHNNRDFRKADSLYRLICSHGDTLRPLAAYSKLAMADNALKSGEFNPEAVLKLYEEALRNSWEMSLEDYYEYAYVLSRLGRNQESSAVLGQLSAYPATYSSNWWRYKIEKDRGNHEKADSLLEESIRLQNLLVRDKIAQSVFKSQSEYYRHEVLSARQEKTILRQRYILATLLLALSSAVVIFLFMRKKRMMSRENDRLLLAMEESEKMLDLMKLDLENEHSAMEDERKAHRKKLQELQKMYAGLYQKQFSGIGKYYDASYHGSRDKASHKVTRKVAAEVGNILSELSSESGNQSKFEARINRAADNIISKIRHDYPGYSEDDIRFICYVIAGFDATTISVLMNITGENVRVKKHRIRARLLRDSGDNAELYRVWLE